MTVHPNLLAATLAAFVDTLIPGDDVFPPASAVGTQALVLDRVRRQLGSEAFARIVAGLDGEGSFIDAAPEGRAAAVRRLEADDPELFTFLRFATYLSYYQLPPVIAALQALGHDYHDAPQPLGYALPPFDPERHLPKQPRGSYKKTEEITRIDISALADLGLPVKGA